MSPEARKLLEHSWMHRWPVNTNARYHRIKGQKIFNQMQAQSRPNYPIVLYEPKHP